MKIESFSDFELQKMRFVVKDVRMLAKFFEGREEENKNYLMNTTKPPVSFVKEMDGSLLLSLIANRTYKGAAEILGVSVAFLHNQVLSVLRDTEVGKFDVWAFTSRDGFSPSSKEEVLELQARVPYMTLLSALTLWNVTKLRKTLGKTQIGVENELISTRGRRAELAYRDLRGAKIQKDMNEEDTRSLYDFEDKDYGRVNVKSVKGYKRKSAQEMCWYFNLSGEEACDVLALVGYCELGENLMFVKLVKSNGLKRMRVEESEVKGEEFLFVRGRDELQGRS